jgi:3-deoxy-D-manno-octulosonic-acid transferase
MVSYQSTWHPFLVIYGKIMRFLYTLLLYIAMPFIFLRLLLRSRRLPAYRQRLAERLGFYPFKLDKCIWLHAVSVGETLAAIPLIKALKIKYPNIPLLVTTMTPTGSARVKAVFGDTVKHVYIPYDLPDAVSRFLNRMHPIAGVIIETELWPNLLAACHHKNIPVCLVNARLSAKSARGYQRIASLTKEIMQHLTHIAAHGQTDASRFYALGAAHDRVSVTGNIKFDLEIAANLDQEASALRQTLGDRFIWIAASTHEGEEEIILAAHQEILVSNPHALLILVPRHPDRFEKIAALCRKSFATISRSSKQICDNTTKVYLGDTMGDLMLLYAASDVAFVGGSLIPSGGHNILEPAALAKPVISGPHDFNFAEIGELFYLQNAMIKVTDAVSLAQAVIQLMQNQDEQRVMGQRALQVMNANRGALAKQLALIENMIP